MHGSRFKTNKVEDRFFEKVTKTDSCWLWHRVPLGKRYGQFRLGSKMIPAHRASWMLHNGKIPQGLYIRHKCDNPICVNPEHLELGTQKDNMNDMTSRKRQSKGSHRPDAILTEEHVKMMRELHASGYYTNNQLARLFGLAENTGNVSSIVKRKTWKHVP